MIQRIIAFTLLIVISPLLIMLYITIILLYGQPFLFRQKRMGKDKEIFTIYKIRTMGRNAEQERTVYSNLNEREDPLFKIHNDPRFTKLGKILSHFGADELPQLFNIVKGEMAFVGPRPLSLPVANKIPAKYNERFRVLPGLTSLWILRETNLSFKDFMMLDTIYVRKKSVLYDGKIFFLSIIKLISQIFK